MLDRTSRLIAIFATSGALLLCIGIGAAEAHVSQLEREALGAFAAEARPIVLEPVRNVTAKQAVATVAKQAPAAQPYIVEVTVSTEEFMAARATHTKAQKQATL